MVALPNNRAYWKTGKNRERKKEGWVDGLVLLAEPPPEHLCSFISVRHVRQRSEQIAAVRATQND